MASRKRIHAGGEELQHQRRAEAIDHQAAQAVALGMDQPIGVGDGVEAEPVGAARRLVEAAGEEGGVDGLGRVARQHAQGDARVAVVEATAHPLAVAVDDVHDAAARQAHGRLFDHLLEDPRVRRAPRDFQSNGGKVLRHG